MLFLYNSRDISALLANSGLGSAWDCMRASEWEDVLRVVVHRDFKPAGPPELPILGMTVI